MSITRRLNLFQDGVGRINEELALAMLNFMERYPKAIAMDYWAQEDVEGCKVCYAGLAALLIGCPAIIKTSETNFDSYFCPKIEDVRRKLGITLNESYRLFLQNSWPKQYENSTPVQRFKSFLLTGV